MTIKECYELMEGDYEGFLKRIGSERYISMLSVRYLDTNETPKLLDAINSQDWKTAFMVAHTLKGVSLNLGFPALAKSSSTLTELLRPQMGVDQEEALRLFKDVEKDDQVVRKALEQFIQS